MSARASSSRGLKLGVAAAVLGMALTGCAVPYAQKSTTSRAPAPQGAASEAPSATQAAPAAVGTPTVTVAPTSKAPVGELTYERADKPARTIVKDGQGTVVATLTDTARTTVLEGPERTFAEPTATRVTVTTTAWVRLLPKPWKAGAENEAWFKTWFEKARKDRSPDVLAISFEYVEGAKEKKDEKGVLIANDAEFGPLMGDGVTRDDGTDIVDYLGIPMTFPDEGTVQPNPQRYSMMDCTGYIRGVLGYRLGYPLDGGNKGGTEALPRRAFAMLDRGPGALLIPKTTTAPTDISMLMPGDLLFFETDSRNSVLDHAGIYLGIDSKGLHRFVSSRMRANGPTMGDMGGDSTIANGGLYGSGFVGARRV